jgi:hypothetical protein
MHEPYDYGVATRARERVSVYAFLRRAFTIGVTFFSSPKETSTGGMFWARVVRRQNEAAIWY